MSADELAALEAALRRRTVSIHYRMFLVAARKQSLDLRFWWAIQRSESVA